MINYQLDKFCAVVTGGTAGIGLEIVNYLSASGARVIFTGSRNKVPKKRNCEYHQVDFLNLQQVEKFCHILKIIAPDILINNAGINKIIPYEDISVDVFLKIQQVNLHVPFMLCQSVLSAMKKKRWGRIINISSIWGEYSKPGRSSYTMSKFGLNGLTKNLAVEMAPYNILVNAVAPGFTNTLLTKSTLKASGIKKISSSIPMLRLANPKEISAFVVWLASQENTYLTGQVITIDGGYICT